MVIQFNNDQSNENLKYLTVEQALADLRHSLDLIKIYINFPNSQLTRPAFIAGGSYSGALSAWFKIYQQMFCSHIQVQV